MGKKRRESAVRDRVFLKLFFKDQPSLTQAEIEYFRRHPDEIDEITAPVNIHKFFLLIGIIVGAILVGISKILGSTSFLSGSPVFAEFVLEIIFEVGVALIGAGVTAYMLGILMNSQ